MIENKSTKIWARIGKLLAFIALLWPAIELYEYLFKESDYKATTKGKHAPYLTLPLYIDELNNNAQYKALYQTIFKKLNDSNKLNIDSLISNSGSFKFQWSDKYDYQNSIVDAQRHDLRKQEYRSISYFEINNVGDKTIEDLTLELPYEGVYKIVLPNDVTQTGMFNQSVKLGDVKPTYYAEVYCWTKEPVDLLEINNESSWFAHRNGIIQISFPIEVEGIYAWDANYKHIPSTILIFILTFALIIIIINVYVLNKSNRAK